MKKAFKANSRTDRFSYLFADVVHTRRLRISALNQNDRVSYRDFLLSDDRGFFKYVGQGWDDIQAEDLTLNYASEIIRHIRNMRGQTLSLAVKRSGLNDILG